MSGTTVGHPVRLPPADKLRDMNADRSHLAGSDRILRTDARRNRERIVRAAREVFTARGIDAPLAAVARRAGVGVATLHRRFPTRDHLVAEAFGEQFGACTHALEKAIDDPDPWRGLSALVHTVFALQAGDRGFTQAFLDRHPHTAGSSKLDEAERALRALVDRCRDAGVVRRDVTAADVTLAFLANAGLVARGSVPRSASARLAGQLLRAFAVSDDSPLPPPRPFPCARC
mgnify:FL=1